MTPWLSKSGANIGVGASLPSCQRAPVHLDDSCIEVEDLLEPYATHADGSTAALRLYLPGAAISRVSV